MVPDVELQCAGGYIPRVGLTIGLDFVGLSFGQAGGFL